MSRYWRWLLILGYPLLIANALVALLYAIVWCRATSWKWREGVLTFVAKRTMLGHPGGQGWSWVVGYASEQHRERASLRVHENCHVVQEMLFAVSAVPVGVVILLLGHPVLGTVAITTLGGALFAIIYGGTFLLGFAARGFKDWHAAYMKIPFEIQAYAKDDVYENMPPHQQVTKWGHR